MHQREGVKDEKIILKMIFDGKENHMENVNSSMTAHRNGLQKFK